MTKETPTKIFQDIEGRDYFYNLGERYSYRLKIRRISEGGKFSKIEFEGASARNSVEALESVSNYLSEGDYLSRRIDFSSVSFSELEKEILEWVIGETINHVVEGKSYYLAESLRTAQKLSRLCKIDIIGGMLSEENLKKGLEYASKKLYEKELQELIDRIPNEQTSQKDKEDFFFRIQETFYAGESMGLSDNEIEEDIREAGINEELLGKHGFME